MVIGWDGACPGFFWLAAQGGYGIQSAAGASALADALLRHAVLPEELARHGVEHAALAPSPAAMTHLDASLTPHVSFFHARSPCRKFPSFSCAAR